MRILATLVAALAVALVVGLTPASAQSPGRNGLIYFTTPDLVDSPPDCGVASTTETGRGYGCIYLGDAFDMTVSRARRLIAESVVVGDSIQIITESLDGRHARQLTHPNEGQNLHPRFSPDGRQIVFDKQGTNADGLYVMNADGSGQRRLTSAPVNDPVFAPDGRAIAYEGQAASAVGLVIADANAGSPHLLVPDSVANTGPPDAPTGSITVRNVQPDFSPNGRQIVFTRRVLVDNGNGASETQSQLEVMGVDGTNVRPLTKPAVLASQPSWSPDGRKIVFSETSGHGAVPNETVWVMNANGTGAREIARGHYPFFSDVPGPIPSLRIKLRVLHLNPARACFGPNDGWGVTVSTIATRQTLYTVSFYLDGRLATQTTLTRDGSFDPGFIRRGHHRVRIVVGDAAIHDTVRRTINFSEC